MNPYVQAAQRILGTAVDGQFGQNDLAALKALIPVVKPVNENDPPWVEEMKAVYGWHEVRDKARLQAWLRSDGKTLGDPTALPWCGDAVATAMHLALPEEPMTGDLAINPYWARNWAGFGRAAMGYGSVGVFSRGPSSGHVGFLVGEDEPWLHVLGGNQSDSVCVTRVEKWRLLATRWSVSYEHDPGPLPRKTAKLPVSVNEV